MKDRIQFIIDAIEFVKRTRKKAMFLFLNEEKVFDNLILNPKCELRP